MSYPKIALVLGCFALASESCTTYNPSLLGSGGAGGGGASTNAGGGGGAKPCGAAAECPGVDDDCTKRACTAGVCGFSITATGTVVAMQTPHDCQEVVCDGQGNMETAAAPNDLPDDMLECTIDSCTMSIPMSTPKMAGTACSQGGGKVCNDKGVCVECIVSADCASQVCDVAAFKCSPAQCGDMVQNGAETDVDCGGATCPSCALGKKCLGNTDCVGQNCSGGTCQPSCSDGTLNNGETDIDCGGMNCSPCASGKTCGANAECLSGKCAAGVCVDVLVLSEIQTRGSNGGNDEFVEIYNAGNAPVTFDNTWTLSARSAVGTCTSNNTGQRFAGSGQVIPAHGHLLYTNSANPGYDGPTPGDGTYATGITDAASVILSHGGTPVDAVCFYFDMATQTNLTICATPYVCEGMPVSNLPHNNTSAGNLDVSLDRKPGGALGNGQDTNDSAADFVNNTPANPQNLASPPAP